MIPIPFTLGLKSKRSNAPAFHEERPLMRIFWVRLCS
jgi:hypothetical protein